MIIKRNRDVMEVFNDRWKANHNKELERVVRNNKINNIANMAGIRGIKPRVIGYKNRGK